MFIFVSRSGESKGNDFRGLLFHWSDQCRIRALPDCFESYLRWWNVSSVVMLAPATSPHISFTNSRR